MRKKMREYPVWICQDCGETYGRKPCGIATWHEDFCDVCGAYGPVTEPRDFGGLIDGWKMDMEE